MSATSQPTGLRPIGRLANTPYEGGTTQYSLTTNNTNAVAIGDFVALVGGSITVPTTNPASATLSANTPIGVVMGFEYQDPARGFVCSQLLKANAISSLGFTAIKVIVADDAGARFVIQANGSVTQANIGSAINMGGFNSDDLVVKTSRIFADTGTISATTNTLSLKIVAIDPTTDNAVGDAFTKIWVKWNAGVHYDTFSAAH